MKTWFQQKNFDKVELIKYKSISEHNVIATVSIINDEFIKNLVDRIEKIPAEGDKMKSFGDQAENIELIFYSSNNKQNVEIYERRFKTPATGFNSGKSENEESLYSDIDALLLPELNKKIPKVKALEIAFKDFSITYNGSTVSGEKNESVTFNKETFIIKNKKNNEQKLEIISGQLPPKAVEFKIKANKLGFFDSTFTLETYNSETEASKRIYPTHFKIR